MSDIAVPSNLCDFELVDKSAIKDVRQWLTDKRWEQIPSILLQPEPRPIQLWHSQIVQSEPQPTDRAAICTSEGIEEQKALLWAKLKPLARRCGFTPFGHEIVRAPPRGFVFDTCGYPFLILPIQFESWKDYVAIEEITLWLREGWAIYTNTPIDVYGAVIFYYVRAKVEILDKNVELKPS